MLADMNTGGLGPDRIKYTANFLGRIRLEIKTFMLGQAPERKTYITDLARPEGALARKRATSLMLKPMSPKAPARIAVRLEKAP